jgi:hypothetical protein
LDRAEKLDQILKMKRGFLLLVALALIAPVARANGPRPFLFLKTGEKFATQEAAAPTVTGLTTYLGEKLTGSAGSFEPHVLNEPVKAVEFCAARKPALGIVTAGFYLSYEKALAMQPLLETRRAGVPQERFVLLGRAADGKELSALQGKTIATTLAGEQRYVISVVLQGKLGQEIRLKQPGDIEGALFDLAENASGSPDAVLAEVAVWNLFKEDPDLGGKLKVLYESDELPRDLVVAFGSTGAGLDLEKLKKAMKEMNDTEDGKRILSSIRVEAFIDIDQNRLSKAKALFHGR